MKKRGEIQKKVLLLLFAGIALAGTRSHKKHFRIIKETASEWRKINKRVLESAIESLYKSRLIDQHNNKDGTTTFILSREGREEALIYNLDKMEIRKHVWDKKWRLVTFDIPEKIKKVRESLRYQLKRLGFKELQRSVFVFPYRCKDEIEYITEFYKARRFIRYIEATHIDNELAIKHEFDLV